jgi:hypothetical protein
VECASSWGGFGVVVGEAGCGADPEGEGQVSRDANARPHYDYEPSRAMAMAKAWRAERQMVYNVPPTLDEIKAAYVADEIDDSELDYLTGFAVEGKVCPDPPLAIQARLYERMQKQVRFSDTTAMLKRVWGS